MSNKTATPAIHMDFPSTRFLHEKRRLNISFLRRLSHNSSSIKHINRSLRLPAVASLFSRQTGLQFVDASHCIFQRET